MSNIDNTTVTDNHEPSTLNQLARRWGKTPGEIYRAAQELHVRAKRMGAHVTRDEQERLRNHFFPVGATRLNHHGDVVRDDRGRDKSAYLAHTRKIVERQHSVVRAVARTTVPEERTCGCCDGPLPDHLPESRRLCTDCLHHPSYHGQDRELVLARAHLDRFREAYLNEERHAAIELSRRREATARANRWAAALIRLMVEHYRDTQGGPCKVCDEPSPCTVWRTLERANRGIATKIINDYYPLTPKKLDDMLDDGIFSQSEDDANDSESSDPPPPIA